MANDVLLLRIPPRLPRLTLWGLVCLALCLPSACLFTPVFIRAASQTPRLLWITSESYFRSWRKPPEMPEEFRTMYLWSVQVHVVGGTDQGVAQLQQEFFPNFEPNPPCGDLSGIY